MKPHQLRIVRQAVIIRLEKGEFLEDILSSYPNLTDEERNTLREELNA